MSSRKLKNTKEAKAMQDAVSTTIDTISNPKSTAVKDEAVSVGRGLARAGTFGTGILVEGTSKVLHALSPSNIVDKPVSALSNAVGQSVAAFMYDKGDNFRFNRYNDATSEIANITNTNKPKRSQVGPFPNSGMGFPSISSQNNGPEHS